MSDAAYKYTVKEGLIRETASGCYDAWCEQCELHGLTRALPPFEMCDADTREMWEQIARRALALLLEAARVDRSAFGSAPIY